MRHGDAGTAPAAGSLRGQLTLFWLLLFCMSAALAIVMVTLYRNSAGAQLAAGQAATERTCGAIATRYAQSTRDSVPAVPDVEMLRVLLNQVLVAAPQVEGGVWQAQRGQLAYAYPTYEGSGLKRDVPAAEEPLIVDMARQAVGKRMLRTDLVRGSRATLIVTACPMRSPGGDLAGWTMTRTGAGPDAQGTLRAGLGALLVLVLASALWFDVILRRGLRQVRGLEAQLERARSDVDTMPELARTGVYELDHIVDGFNRYRERFDAAQARLREVALQRSRDQRLAALGRMSASIAHEIRNPIAAMRLKAENALVAAPERQGAALHAVVGQIDRLEGLVQSLLALVQPVVLTPRPVTLRAWLDERVAAVADRAARGSLRVVLRHTGPETAVLDPLHLGRAVDNLLDNAVRHAPRGGEVVLEARMTDAGRLAIRVDDDGQGVPETLRAALFEPFATGSAEGTGLGLALAREVALAHGGDLHYVALAPGARFELELPWRVS